MLDRRGLWIGILLSCAVFFGIVAHWRLNDPATRFNTALSSVMSCLAGSNPTVCARPYIEALLTQKDGGDLIAEFDSRFTQMQCHYLGHVVGQETYRKYKDIEVAINHCSYECDSACIHGIIGEAFAEELGVEDPEAALNVDLQHLSSDEMIKVGASLCTNPKTCHGVGHTLYQAYGEIAPALKLCKQIAGDREQFCQHGVFMEYGDVLGSRNMRAPIPIQAPATSTLSTFCDYPDQATQSSCLRYLPLIVHAVFQKEGDSEADAMNFLRAICLSYGVEDRLHCIAGYGAFSSYSLATDVSESHHRCGWFAEAADQAACNAGMISVATIERKDNVLAYCGSARSKALKSLCYQTMFYIVHLLGADTGDFASRCSDDSCRAQERNYATEPITNIRRELHP